MKAVILAAGKGTRMGDLTDGLPKPMLQVESRPMLEHIMTGLCGAGISEFCIIVGWKAEVIEDYIGDASHWDVAISYVRQQVQDGTGKAPELAKDFVGDKPFLLTYGDILVKIETYRQMLKRWGEGDFAGLVTVTGSAEVTKGGLFFFDEKFHLNHLVETPTTAHLDELRAAGRLQEGDTAWYNAGIHIFIPTLFEHTARWEKSPGGEYELTDAWTSMLNSEEPVAGLEIAGRWVDVRDPEVLRELQEGC